jgi:hypothetical protein
MVAVYAVFDARALVGVKDAVDPAKVTTPATATGGVPAVKVKVVVLMVAGFIASLKTAVTTVAEQTPTAPLAGAPESAVGGTQASPEVVKLHTTLLASATPTESLAPVVMVAV